jgi:hypothetical protein
MASLATSASAQTWDFRQPATDLGRTSVGPDQAIGLQDLQVHQAKLVNQHGEADARLPRTREDRGWAKGRDGVHARDRFLMSR